MRSDSDTGPGAHSSSSTYTSTCCWRHDAVTGSAGTSSTASGGRRLVSACDEKAGKGRRAVSIDAALGLRGDDNRGFAGVSEPRRPVTRSGDTTTVSCASGISSASIPPPTRESSFHAGYGVLEVARPGLEPGTPRFSVVRSRFSNGCEILAKQQDSSDLPDRCEVRKFRSFLADSGDGAPFISQSAAPRRSWPRPSS